MSDKIGIFSFFAGAGFLDLGFEKAKAYETLFVNEVHKPFIDIYRHSREKLNIKTPLYGHHVTDIEEFLTVRKNELIKYYDQAKSKYNIIGFIGGPPCPDFSVGGKNKGHSGENGRLSGTYVDILCNIKPDFFLFENVKGLWRTKKHRAFYESLKNKLFESGYLISEKLINSIEYGTPQDRDRIILIGFNKSFLSNNNYGFNGTSYLWDFDWNKAITYDKRKVFDLPWGKTEAFDEDSIKPAPENLPVELTVEYWFRKNEVETHPNSLNHFTPRAGLAKFKNIAEGDDRKKSYKRLHRWRYSPTAAYGNNEVHLHPYKARRISAAEALALQSLPKTFEIPAHISLTNIFKAIGNGVPYVTAKGLAFTILNFISKLQPQYKIHVNGKDNGAKHSVLYKPITEVQQLSVLEPKEQRINSN